MCLRGQVIWCRSQHEASWGLIRPPKFWFSPPRKPKTFVEVGAEAPSRKTRGMEKAWEQITRLVSNSVRVHLTRSRVQGHQRSKSVKRHGSRPSHWPNSPWTCVGPLAGMGRSARGGSRPFFATNHFTMLSKPDRQFDLSGINC